MNKLDLMEMMKNGMSAGDLADAFTKELNAAVAEMRAQEEAKKKAEAALAQKKTERAGELATVIFNFLEDYYPDLYEPRMREVIDAKAVIEILNESARKVREVAPLMEALAGGKKMPFSGQVKISAKPIGAKPEKDPILDFLKNEKLL